MSLTPGQARDADNKRQEPERESGEQSLSRRDRVADNGFSPGLEIQALADLRAPYGSFDGPRARAVQSLQGSHGNAYVQRLLAQRASSRTPLVQQAEDENRLGEAYEVSSDVAARIDAERASGRTLDPQTKDEMEATLGRNLPGVRLHTGTRADRLAKRVHAEAFATGKDIFFRQGRYAPASLGGRDLLAHELAHVAHQEQSGDTADSIQRLNENVGGQATAPVTAPATTPAPTPSPGLPGQSGTSPAAPGPEAPTTAEEQRYNLTIGRRELTNVTPQEAIRALRHHYNGVRNRTLGEQDGHRFLIDLREQQYIVGFFADVLGGVTMPPIEMWRVPLAILDAVRDALDAGDVEDALDLLRQAEEQYVNCHRRYYDYREGTVSGAERSVTVLQVTAAAGAVAATVATGGLAAGAGLGTLGTATAIGVAGGTYGMAQEAAGQFGEIGVATRESFDLGPILRRGAVDAVTNFVGAFAGGALSGLFRRAFGSYLANVGDDVLIELGEQMGLRGPLPRDFFLTQGQRFIADFLGGAGASPLTTSVQVVVRNITGGGPLPSAEQFAEMVARDMIQGGALQLFLGGVMHGARMARLGGGSRGTPELVPPEQAGVPHETGTAEGRVPAEIEPSPEASTPEAGAAAAGRPGARATPVAEEGPPTLVEGPPEAMGRTPEMEHEARYPGEEGVPRVQGPPEGQVSYPDGLVEYGLTEAGARRSYRASLAEDIAREAGIWRDVETGECICVQGNSEFVTTDWWRDPHFTNRRWQLVEHYHPSPQLRARFASPADYEAMFTGHQLAGTDAMTATESTIRWTDPDTHVQFTTEFGFNPDLPSPFWLRYRDPAGNWQVEMFSEPPWNPGSGYRSWLQSVLGGLGG